jgi:hypothetical protein
METSRFLQTFLLHPTHSFFASQYLSFSLAGGSLSVGFANITGSPSV